MLLLFGLRVILRLAPPHQNPPPLLGQLHRGKVGTVPSITTPLPDGNKVEEPSNVLCGVTPGGNVSAFLATLGSLVGRPLGRGSVTRPSPPGSLPRGPTSLGSWPSSCLS